MSRVIYRDTPATADQETLRRVHGVRLVSEVEEGTGVNALPEGVFGYTYSPGLQNAPVFAVRRYRSYEIHKVRGGEVFIVGFVRDAIRRQLETASGELTVSVHAEPDADADGLVTIPYSRIRYHRQHSAPNQERFTVTVLPDATAMTEPRFQSVD